MGLDMWLAKKIYVGGNYPHNKVTGTIDIVRHTGEANEKHLDIPLDKVSEIILELAYWRKANQIHKWFVDNVQEGVDDCKPHEVYGERLLELIDICKQVLADHSKAEELLPVCKGFFFGTYDYDEYYYKGLEDTIEQLSDLDTDCWYQYDSSW